MLRILSFLVTCCLVITFKSLSAAEHEQVIGSQDEQDTGSITIDNTLLDTNKLSDTNTLKQSDQTSQVGPADQDIAITSEPEVDIKVHSVAAGDSIIVAQTQEEGLTPLKSSVDFTSESTTSTANVEPASHVLNTQNLQVEPGSHVLNTQNLQVEPASHVLNTQNLEPHQGKEDKQDATDSSREAVKAPEITVGEVSTVQDHVLPTTAPDGMGHMSSLVDTPTLDDYLYQARILDSVPLVVSAMHNQLGDRDAKWSLVGRLERTTDVNEDWRLFHEDDKAEEDISPHQPSLYLEPMTYDHLQATESLKTIVPGTWDGMSRYSAGIGGSVLEEDSKARSGDDFPTFDKWSVQYLAEQEKQKTEKDKENSGGQGLPAGLAAKKLRHNFAAASCGAKVIDSNAEAENNNHLLNGNPDEYMLNPCKAKKWFVVELCEPLQIHRVEIGTVELFASQPKSFRVFASSRYPTKEWTSLGKYEMSPLRAVQSFATTLSEEFVKFVKVEMLDHHGDEHYCPLTAFKVLGIDMSEEEFENENEAIEVEGQEAASDIEDDSVEGSVNLFTSAKETVVKLVQKVWYKGDQEAGSDGKGEKHLEGEIPAVNSTVAEVVEDKGESSPCSHRDSSSIPLVSIPPVGVVVPASVPHEAEEVPIVTKLTDSEQVPTDDEAPVVIKLGADPDLPVSVCPHNFWSSYVNLMMSASQSTSLCGTSQQGGFKPIRQKSAASEMVHADQSRESPQPEVIQVNVPADSLGESSVISLEVDLKISDISSLSVSPDQHASSQAAVSNLTVASLSSRVADAAESSASVGLEASSVAPDSLHHHHVPEESSSKATQEVISSQSSSFTSAGVSVTNSEQLEPSSVSSYRELENEAVSSITPGLHIQKSQVVEQGASDLAESMFLKVSPSPTLSAEDSQEGQAQMPTSIDPPEALGTPQLKEPGTLPLSESNVTEAVEQSKTQGDSVSNGSQALKAGKTIDLVKVGMTSVGKRDNSIMKLNNRIIALEQNVSMTKKYLEELSRVFKQQNEEMMKLLNKTEKRVTVFVAQSEDKDLRQQDNIDVLEQKVVNLTQTVEDLQLRLETLDKQVSDGHCLLLFFQAGLFLWMLVSTIRGRSKQSLAYSDHQFLLDTMPKQPSMESNVRQRRNSDTGPGQVTNASMSMTTLKRQKSDTNIAAAGKTDETSDVHNRPYQQDVSHVTKRKKKKKSKPDIEPSLSRALSDPLQTSSFSSSAGVLFGTSISSAKGSSGQTSTRCDNNADNVSCSSRYRPKMNNSNSFSKMETGEEDQALVEKSLFIDQWHALPVSSRDDLSSALGARRRVQGSPIPAHRKSFSGGMNLGEEGAKSPEFTLPSYHKGRFYRSSDGVCDECGLRTKPQLKNTRGKHSSLEETGRSADFVNPKFGHEFFLAENYLHENRFRFLSSPNKDAMDRISSCPVCSERKAGMVCPMCFDNSTTLYTVSPGSSDLSRTALGSHYSSLAKVDVQPLPAVILCPATLAQAVVSGAVSSLSRQSSFSSSASSASSVAFGPQARVAGGPRLNHDHNTAHLSTPHHLPPPPRPPPPALSTLSLTKMKENARTSVTSSDILHSADESSVHGTGHITNGTSRKLPSTQHPQKSKKSLGSLQYGASKSMEKDPHQKLVNPKILVKSSSLSSPHSSKPSATSQSKKSATSKLLNSFRKS